MKTPARDTLVESEEIGMMATYGITRVPVDYYHFKEFRYTNLRDAVAQARRKK